MKQAQVTQFIDNHKNKTCKIIEIFDSLSGEGSTIGIPVSFVRVANCNLRCSFCDTKYSYNECEATNFTFSEVLEKLKEFDNEIVVCTGGEPLLTDNNSRLLPLFLSANGYKVYVETNGSVKLFSKEELLKNELRKNIKYVVDLKCPYSKMNIKDILETNAELLDDGDEIKCVVANKEDFDFAIDKINKIKNIIKDKNINIIFSPVFNAIDLAELAEMIKSKKQIIKNTKMNIKMGIQLHKIIWPQIEKGV